MKSVHLQTFLFVLFLFAANNLVRGQEIPQRDTTAAVDTLQTLFETETEDLLESATQDVEDSELLDRLQRLEEDPLDINDATMEEFQIIPGVTPIIARNIVETREKIGKFTYLSDLFTIDGIDERLYAVIKRYVRVAPFIPTELKGSYRSRTVRDLQTRRGFTDGTYPGSPWRVYNRLRTTYAPSVDVGALIKKDAGETKFNDFTSGFVMLKPRNAAVKVIFGDYLAEFAQGIAVWRSLAFSKGLEVIQPAKKAPRGISPYVSSDENNFYRGAAASLNLSSFEATTFYSNKSVDASIDTSGQITSIYGTGLHRTGSELRRRLSARERSVGGRLQYSLGNLLRVGTTYYSTKFDHPFLSKNLFDFSGNENHLVGGDFDFTLDKFNLFGEWARSNSGAVGGISGMFVRFARGADFVVTVRNYPRDFVSLHGFGFGERSGATQDEFGIYTGFRLRVMRGVLLSAYYDQFKFPWATATIPFPIQGTDFLGAAELRPFRRFTLELKYKAEVKGDAITTTDEFGRDVKRLADRRQRNGRVTAAFDVSRDLRVKGRLELVRVEYSQFSPSGKGILLYQDLRWRATSRMTLDARLIFFDTDSFDSRIYEFESELRGTLLNPSLYGKGRRWYVVVRYTLVGGVDLSAKYAETYRDDVKSLHSGADEILNNLENRFSAQIDVRF